MEKLDRHRNKELGQVCPFADGAVGADNLQCQHDWEATVVLAAMEARAYVLGIGGLDMCYGISQRAIA